MINESWVGNNRKCLRNKSAFTLVEVMVAIFISTLLLTSVFMVWSKIQRGIVRSNTKQSLLNELRNVSNHMQNDFKSIKYDEETFSLSEGGEGNFSMSFEKFKETEDGKLAQDSVEKVTYELKNKILTRIGDKRQMLSIHCEGVSIKRATADATGSGDLESSDEDFKAGREAKLDIEISGKMPIPGVNDEMFHVEKTSVVMRNEYSKKVNKNYISTFDLIKKDANTLIQDGSTAFFPNGALDPDAIKLMTDEALGELKDTQNDMLSQTLEQLESINKSISDTDDGRSTWTTICNWFTPGSQPGERVKNWRNTLEKAKTESEVNAVKGELKEWVNDEEINHMSKSSEKMETPYARLSDKDKELFKKAYDMKVQDRLVKQVNESNADSEGYTPMELTIDQYKNQDSSDTFKDAKGNTIELKTDSESETNRKNEAQAIAQNDAEDKAKIIAFYEKINVDWMDEDDYKEDMDIYSAAKSLLSQADTKIDIIKAKDTYQSNIDMIDDELRRRGK